MGVFRCHGCSPIRRRRLGWSRWRLRLCLGLGILFRRVFYTILGRRFRVLLLLCCLIVRLCVGSLGLLGLGLMLLCC